MFIYKNSIKNIKSLLYQKKIKKMSNASFYITKIKSLLPLQYKYKKLLYFKKSNAGRSKYGQIVVYSKGKKKKLKINSINYKFRSKLLFFIAGINYINYNNNIFSVIINSLGEVSYIPVQYDTYLFFFLKLKELSSYKLILEKNLIMVNKYKKIQYLSFLIIQQKKNKPLNYLEIKPLTGIKYTRSFGSKAYLIKSDTRTGLGLIKLSSGLKKIISIFALSSNNSISMNILKSGIKSTKASNFKSLGFKSKVRGNAKNPVDHPHGGRTKSIKYQKTPWGKTTKFK